VLLQARKTPLQVKTPRVSFAAGDAGGMKVMELMFSFSTLPRLVML